VFGIGGFELLIIIAFMLVIFGPEKLPDLARTVGKAMRQFKSAQEEMEKLIRVEMYQADRKEAGLGPIAGGAPAADAAADEPEAEAEPAKPASPAAAIWAATEDDEEDDEA